MMRHPVLRCAAARCFHAPCDGQRFAVKGARDHPWQQWRRLERFLATKQVCVIDGANGTEIQRRGGRPAETFSTGTAALQRPDLCQEVHKAYLDAGADIIITHSYSSNGNVMSPSGNGGRVHECILSAASLARRATLNHIADHAMDLSNRAAASAAAAAHAAAAASTAAARATTSLMSNSGALTSAQGSLATAQQAHDSATVALHTLKEVHACATAADAAANAALAASEGELLAEATGEYLAPLPEPVSIPGWDAAGFGPALVVGSLSTHPPEMTAGGESSAAAKWPAEDVEAQYYLDAARSHALSGVDMLFLEMMKDRVHAPRAVRAAASSGLPVFMGISTRTDRETGNIVMWGTGVDAVPLSRDWFHSMASVLGESLVGVNVMHTDFSSMEPTLKFVREECGWQGALGAYPDHGRFEAPDWIFAELDTSDAMERVEKWIQDYDVQLIGGCCGLGPEYITAVSALARHHNAKVRQEHVRNWIQQIV